MKIACNLFFLQKGGNVADECEDRAFPSYTRRNYMEYFYSNKTFHRFALADGATEGLFSSSWADILVKDFARSHTPSIKLNVVIEKAYEGWSHWIKNHIEQRERSN